MISLLRALHATAARRGDGLREELQRTNTPPAAWSDGSRVLKKSLAAAL